MAIMKAIEKCIDCYKDEKCLLTLSMRDFCKGPYENKQMHIKALQDGIYSRIKDRKHETGKNV